MKEFVLYHYSKVELSYVFTIKILSIAETVWKSEVFYKNSCFPLVGYCLRPSNNSRPLIFNINAGLDSVNLLRFTKMVNCLPEFEYFYCILEKNNIIYKIRRPKVTDYAGLIDFLVSCGCI